ncbi:MAG: DUF6242 domain-containing protein [Cyclobacteriaceae bacterium]
MNKRLPNFRLLAVLTLGLSLSFLFSCNDDDEKLSDLTGLIGFSLDGFTADFTIDQAGLTITNGTDSLPFGTDVTALVAVYETVDENTVTVADVEQESGVTVNDFSSPIDYTVIAEDGTANIYTVSVNVSQVDPETVSWNKVTEEQWDAYEVVRTATVGGNLFVYGYTKNTSSFATTDIVGTYMSSDEGATWTMVDARDTQYNYVDEEEGYLMPQGRSVGMVEDFNGKIWSIGGWARGRQDEEGNRPFDDPVNDVWSSTDGLAWTKHTLVDSITFSAREDVTALNYDSKMWVIGGNGAGFFGALGAPLNDVWSTTDGTTYTQVTESAAFPARTAPASIVFDGKMWIFGGLDGGSVLLNDVWSSTDGATWTEESSAAAFPARKAAEVFAFNGKLFLIGGEGADGVQYADMWVSEDGVTWAEVAETDAFAIPNTFTGRSDFGVIVDGLNIYLIGGKGPIVDEVQTYLSDVWKGKGVE